MPALMMTGLCSSTNYTQTATMTYLWHLSPRLLLRARHHAAVSAPLRPQMRHPLRSHTIPRLLNNLRRLIRLQHERHLDANLH